MNKVNYNVLNLSQILELRPNNEATKKMKTLMQGKRYSSARKSYKFSFGQLEAIQYSCLLI